MAIGPAMLLAGLGALALTTLGKKGSAPGAPALPSGAPPAGGSSGDPLVQSPAGPIPIMLPKSFHDLLVKTLQNLTVKDDGTIAGPVTPAAVQQATTVAAQLEAAGFVEAANALRQYAKLAATKIPAPAPDKVAPLPGVSPDLVAAVNRAIQLERDPKRLQEMIDTVLRSAPPSKERDNLVAMLGEAIKQVQAAMVLSDTLKKTNEVLTSPGLPPVTTTPAPVITVPMVVEASAPTKPADVPDTTESRRAVNLTNHLRNKVVDAGGDVKKAKGKEDKGLVMAFQRAEGLGADGLMGPGSTLRLAKYTGDLPPVFYWPKSATSKNVLDYRAKLLEWADKHESEGRTQVAAKIRAAAAKERGQSGIVGQMPA